MAGTDYKPFAVGLGNEVTSLPEYFTADWRTKGWIAGILPHQQINRVLRQATMVASALAQTIADYSNLDVPDDGDLSSLVTRMKGAISAAGLPFNPAVGYPSGSVGDYLNHIASGGTLTSDQLAPLLQGLISESFLAGQLLSRINLIDAPTTGLVTKVSDLTNTYGSTASAAASAAAAATAATNAIAAQNAASISAGAAFTSETNANTSKLNAATSASNASTSAINAASSASSAAGSASSASTSASAAATSASAAATSATAASNSASQASTSATNAGTFATAAQNSATSAATQAGNAATSASAAATSATSAAGSASVATTQANLATSAASNAANSAAAAAAAGAAVGGLNVVVRQRAVTLIPVDLSWGLSGWGYHVVGTGVSVELLQLDLSPLTANTPYSASFKAKVVSGGSAATLAVSFQPATLPSTNITIGIDGTVTYTWQNVSSASSAWASAQLRMDAVLQAGMVVEITDIKVEQGATATAYTPSPIDLRNYANSALTAANTATSQATAAGSSATSAANSATQASTFANNASISAGNASTSASQASMSATNAADSASNAATSASAAATSATAAGGLATAASNSASLASTSATSAQTSANAAASSATAAQSYASNASTSANQAAISATNAAGSASSASSSASAASSSATTAGTQATAASVSASNAATSATNASNSATAASNWYNQTVAATGTLSTSVTQLQSSVATHTGQLTNLESQWLLKVVATRSDGKVVLGGIGVGATANGTVGQSSIVLTADSLIFVPSSNPNASPTGLMTVGTVNGVTTLIIPAAIIGDLTVGTSAIQRGATQVGLYAATVNFSKLTLDFTIVTSDVNPVTGLVQVELIASNETTTAKSFDLSLYNLATDIVNLSQLGNLVNSTPPGGVVSYHAFATVPVGNYRAAFYNHDGGNAGITDAQDRHRSLIVRVVKR